MSKYKNPIMKPNMVTIPAWEYAALVRASTMNEMTVKLVNGLEEYRLREVLDVLYKDKDEGEAEE